MGVVLFGGRGIIFPYIGFLFARQSRFPTGFYVIYIDKIMMTCTSVFHFSTTNILSIACHSKTGERKLQNKEMIGDWFTSYSNPFGDNDSCVPSI